MSKENIKLSIKRVFTDRPFLTLITFILIAGGIYVLMIGFTIQPRDIQVYTHYTAFGEKHYYKSHWYYLVSFLVFGIVVVIGHIALMIKMHNLGRRQTAMVIGFLTLVVLLVALFYGRSIMGLAFR